MALDQKAAQRILDTVLAAARQIDKGAQVQAELSSGKDANIRFARSEITSCGEVEETSLEVSAQLGKRHASASTNQTDPGAIRAVVERAHELLWHA